MKRATIGIRQVLAVACAALLVQAQFPSAVAQTPPPASPPAADAKDDAPRIPNDQLDALVAPIALFPDPLLAQTLVASTYPLEIVQLQQWLTKNKELKDKALEEAVAKQPWDPSIQSMAAVPEVVKRLSDDIQWTTDLGNAFLAQQSDVMDAVQRMRKKAEDTGALKTNEQQKVEKQTVEGKTVIVVESANPEVVYVPSYNPTVVYGPPVYPYPPIYYPPPYYGGAMFMSFSVGIMVGAAWGGMCCGCGWGGNDVNINVNNNFNRNNINTGNIGSGNRPGGGAGGGNWQHNPSHRGGTPYSNKATANKFGGTTGSSSLANRQASARQQVGREGGNMPSTRQGGGPSAGTRQTGGTGGSGANQIGSKDIPRSSSSSSRGGALGGGSGGYNGSSARASSSRGRSSMGGGSRGGGGRGGGGGGRRR